MKAIPLQVKPDQIRTLCEELVKLDWGKGERSKSDLLGSSGEVAAELGFRDTLHGGGYMRDIIVGTINLFHAAHLNDYTEDAPIDWRSDQDMINSLVFLCASMINTQLNYLNY